MDEKNEVFGKRLKILRNKKKKNQEDVAKDLGISRARYSHYENNHVEPDIDLIRKLADYHNVNTDYLLGRTNKPNGSSESDKNAIIDKIAKEFPDADLMFGDLASMDAEQLEEVYEFIAFKARRKK
ncbi:helix-turn-helix domain-containing protein [Virgibacillus alimentarius]|uniref:helix-turn-helix domain-containing protein n=1 Tax=Virgibacillus alimentarius TaxID=698769 RepID=UPI00385007A8